MENHERQLEQSRDGATEAGEHRLYGIVERALENLQTSVDPKHEREAVQAAEAIVAQAQTELDKQVAAQTPEVMDMAERILKEAEATRIQPGQAIEAPIAVATEAQETAAYLQNARHAVDAAATDYPPNPDFAPSPFDAQAASNVATMEQPGTGDPEVDQAVQAFLAEPESMN